MNVFGDMQAWVNVEDYYNLTTLSSTAVNLGLQAPGWSPSCAYMALCLVTEAFSGMSIEQINEQFIRSIISEFFLLLK